MNAEEPVRGLPRVLLALGVLAAGWLVLFALNQLQGIAGPLLLVVNLLVIAQPVQAALNRRGLPRMVGAVAAGLIVFLILAAFFATLAWSVASLVRELPYFQGRFVELYRNALQQLEGLGVTESQISEGIQQISPTSIARWATTALQGMTGVLGVVVIIVTVLFVMLIDSLSFPERALALRGSRPAIAQSLRSFSLGVRRYWVVSSIFGLIVAALDVVLLVWLDVPLAGVWGVLSFLTNFIPNVGFVLGVIPPAIMGLLAHDWQTALAVVAFYSVINFVIQSVIQPKFNGEAVGVTATVSLLSLLLWTWVLGPLGALLALPATLLVKSLLVDPYPDLRWLNALIASEPGPGLPQGEPAPAD